MPSWTLVRTEMVREAKGLVSSMMVSEEVKDDLKEEAVTEASRHFPLLVGRSAHIDDRTRSRRL